MATAITMIYALSFHCSGAKRPQTNSATKNNGKRTFREMRKASFKVTTDTKAIRHMFRRMAPLVSKQLKGL